MPRYLSISRKIVVALGALCLAAGTLFFLLLPKQAEEREEDVQIGAASLCVGAFLVIPHRRVMNSRLAPFWLGLSFLLPAVTAYGLAVTFWAMFKNHAFNPMIAASFLMWLLFCANAEYARRTFSQRASAS